jgi:hypothetical protein
MTHRAASSPDEIQFQVLRRLHQKPDSSQRMLARELNISLGSVNYCFQASRNYKEAEHEKFDFPHMA